MNIAVAYGIIGLLFGTGWAAYWGMDAFSGAEGTYNEEIAWWGIWGIILGWPFAFVFALLCGIAWCVIGAGAVVRSLVLAAIDSIKEKGDKE